MRIGRATLLVAGVLGPAACGEPRVPAACATTIAREVCEIPSSLRGAEPVQETWTSDPPPELVGLPLTDGRYVQTARTLYCRENYDPPPVLSSVQSVLEIRGCVMRVTASQVSEQALVVGVQTFSYAADGTLDLTEECPARGRRIAGTPYGFDGTTLQLPQGGSALGPGGQAYVCDDIDTWELR